MLDVRLVKNKGRWIFEALSTTAKKFFGGKFSGSHVHVVQAEYGPEILSIILEGGLSVYEI